MTPADVMAEAGRLGIALFPDGDGLGYDAPDGVMTPGFRAALIANKAGILAHLGGSPAGTAPAPAPAPEPGWVEWARGLDPARWSAWRAVADRLLATMPPGGKPGERLERSLELAWRRMTGPGADDVADAGPRPPAPEMVSSVMSIPSTAANGCGDAAPPVGDEASEWLFGYLFREPAPSPKAIADATLDGITEADLRSSLAKAGVVSEITPDGEVWSIPRRLLRS
jgi:TubC N-terminal docking domain